MENITLRFTKFDVNVMNHQWHSSKPYRSANRHKPHRKQLSQEAVLTLLRSFSRAWFCHNSQIATIYLIHTPTHTISGQPQYRPSAQWFNKARNVVDITHKLLKLWRWFWYQSNLHRQHIYIVVIKNLTWGHGSRSQVNMFDLAHYASMGKCIAVDEFWKETL